MNGIDQEALQLFLQKVFKKCVMAFLYNSLTIELFSRKIWKFVLAQAVSCCV